MHSKGRIKSFLFYVTYDCHQVLTTSRLTVTQKLDSSVVWKSFPCLID